MNIVLASASPRRKELLGKIVSEFQIIPSKCEEIIPDDIDSIEVAEYLAFQKAVDVWKEHKDDLVIGSDTVVILDGKILGKPKDKDDAVRMLQELSGKEHKVVTGVAIMTSKQSSSFSCTTKVKFSKMTECEIEWYVASAEPMDKAGAYGIQGLGGIFVEGIIGDYFNVMGLPINLLYSTLKNICPEKLITQKCCWECEN
ncbi:MAG: Maf family protein [Oscillospiraceae bacterium]